MIRNIRKYRTMSFDMSGSVMVLYSYCLNLSSKNCFYFKYLVTALFFLGLTSFSGTYEPIILREIVPKTETGNFSFNEFDELASESNPDLPPCLLTVQNSCTGGSNVTFTLQNNNTSGTWTIGGGTFTTIIGSSTITVTFTPGSTPGCFNASYTTSGCSVNQNFIIFPPAPALTAPSNTCNAALTIP